MAGFFAGPLEPGQCKTQLVQASVQPLSRGGWYLGAVADPGLFLPELIESNNTRASGLIQFHPRGVGPEPRQQRHARPGPFRILD